MATQPLRYTISQLNCIMTRSTPAHPHVHSHTGPGGAVAEHADQHLPPALAVPLAGSILGWPAWLRVVAVLPVLLLLWLAVGWASAEVAPW